MSHLLAIIRDEFNKLQRVESSTNQFRSERNMSHYQPTVSFGEGWIPERVMNQIPLSISNDQIIQRDITGDYDLIPENLRSVFDKGLLRTSGETPTDYSILMSVTEHNDNRAPEGRTGILLYQGEPVKVDVGGKEFIVEIKGVGCPDGDNTRTDEMIRGGYFGQSVKRFGSATESEGKREFANLELQRRKSTTFDSGDSVRAAALFVYKNDVEYGYESDREDQGYLVRLTPSNVRSSFNQNPDFPHIEDRENLLATSLGNHYAELANLDEVLLHSAIHPENVLFTGSRYVLTDFADCRRLDQIDNPYEFIGKVFDKIQEVPGLSESGFNAFYQSVAEGLGVEWDSSTGYEGFVDSIWSGFFAEKVYDMRKGKDDEAQKKIDAHKEMLPLRKNKGDLHYLDITGAQSFLEGEVNLLQHVNTPEAVESVNVAKQRIKYLTRQVDGGTDINQKFKADQNTFYDLFILPYMSHGK